MVNKNLNEICPRLGWCVWNCGIYMVGYLSAAVRILGVLRWSPVDGNVAVVQLLGTIMLWAGAGPLVFGTPIGFTPWDVSTLGGRRSQRGGMYAWHRLILIPSVSVRRASIPRIGFATNLRMVMLLFAPGRSTTDDIWHGIAELFPKSSFSPSGDCASPQQGS